MVRIPSVMAARLFKPYVTFVEKRRVFVAWRFMVYRTNRCSKQGIPVCLSLNPSTTSTHYSVDEINQVDQRRATHTWFCKKLVRTVSHKLHEAIILTTWRLVTWRPLKKVSSRPWIMLEGAPHCRRLHTLMRRRWLDLCWLAIALSWSHRVQQGAKSWTRKLPLMRTIVLNCRTGVFAVPGITDDPGEGLLSWKHGRIPINWYPDQASFQKGILPQFQRIHPPGWRTWVTRWSQGIIHQNHAMIVAWDTKSHIIKAAPNKCGIQNKRICSYCSTTSTHRNYPKCARCREVRYCSKDCQQSHWKQSHKDQCRKALKHIVDPPKCLQSRKHSYRTKRRSHAVYFSGSHTSRTNYNWVVAEIRLTNTYLNCFHVCNNSSSGWGSAECVISQRDVGLRRRESQL